MFEELSGLACEAGDEGGVGRSNLECLHDAETGACLFPSAVGKGNFFEDFAGLEGEDGVFTVIGVFQKRFDVDEGGFGVFGGFADGFAFGVKVDVPDGEIGADVFFGGAGDGDALAFADFEEGAGGDACGEDKPGGEEESGEEAEELRFGGGVFAGVFHAGQDAAGL